MNRDELIELKNEILGEKRYVALRIDKGNVEIISGPMTLDEINSKVDTAGVVKQYEDGITNAVRLISKNGEDIANLSIVVNTCILCEVNMANRLVNLLEERDYVSAEGLESLDRLDKELKEFLNENYDGNILTNYSVIDDKDVYMTGETPYYEELSIAYSDGIDCSFRVNGFIKINELKQLVENLGFQICIESSRYDDYCAEYVSDLIMRKYNYPFIINIDFTNKKSK